MTGTPLLCENLTAMSSPAATLTGFAVHVLLVVTPVPPFETTVHDMAVSTPFFTIVAIMTSVPPHVFPQVALRLIWLIVQASGTGAPNCPPLEARNPPD